MGCTGNRLLSESVTTFNKEVATLQDQALLLNILRLSQGRPTHFTSLSIICGRNRLSGGLNLRLPFGADAPSTFSFEPSFSAETGPQFEVQPLNNQEFLRGFVTPIGLTAVQTQLAGSQTLETALAVAIARIRLLTRRDDRIYVNDPGDPNAYAAFRRVLDDFVEQGLTTEQIELVRCVSPPFDGPLQVDNLLEAERQGLVVEPAEPGAGTRRSGGRRFRLLRLDLSLRFCFLEPRSELAYLACCSANAGRGPLRLPVDDPRTFGAPGAPLAVFDANVAGRIEIELRSPASVLEFLRSLIRARRRGTLPARAGQQPLFVVEEGPSAMPALVSVELDGMRYAIPAGPAGGLSGEAFTLASRLVALAQSMRDLPVSNAVTIVGE